MIKKYMEPEIRKMTSQELISSFKEAIRVYSSWKKWYPNEDNRRDQVHHRIPWYQKAISILETEGIDSLKNFVNNFMSSHKHWPKIPFMPPEDKENPYPLKEYPHDSKKYISFVKREHKYAVLSEIYHSLGKIEINPAINFLKDTGVGTLQGRFYALILWEENGDLNALLQNKDKTFSCCNIGSYEEILNGGKDSLRSGWSIQDGLRYKLFSKPHAFFCDDPDFVKSNLLDKVSKIVNLPLEK